MKYLKFLIPTGIDLNEALFLPIAAKKQLGINTNINRTTLRFSYNFLFRNLSALPITDTELNAIAALAIIGLSKIPNHG